jgi:hypothetical protein
LLIHGRVAGCEQELVALAKRQLELLAEMQHHFAARLRAARLDEAEMACRDVGLERELELAQPASGAPLAQQLTE